MQTTFTINGNTITCDAAMMPAIIAQFCGSSPAPKAKSPKSPKRAKKPVTLVEEDPITPAKARGYQWYDALKSAHTTVSLKKDTVQVKVAYGHAPEWHDKLRHEGFTWSKKGFWWAYLDVKRRQKVADKNIANDTATAGMSKEERREYWRNRNAARRAIA